ncbi:MAG: IMP dehydrogenase [Candidatus Hermodarchaeota archaeon]
MSEHKFIDKFLNAKQILTFNDVILLPGHTNVEPNEVDVQGKVTKRHNLKIPFISSPMDTVTEADMAIALAREGGVGVLHRNCSLEEEVAMAKQVKRAESFIIRDVFTINPESTVAQALAIMTQHSIHGLPVTVDTDDVVGIITGRDVRYADPELRVKDVMTPKERLISADPSLTPEQARNLLHKHRIEKIPIINSEGKLIGLVTTRDIELKGDFPHAARDEEGRLLCGAAVSPFDFKRAVALDEWVDFLIVDVAHFDNQNVINATKKIIEAVSVEVIAGNIGTKESALNAVSTLEDVAGLRCGIGSGSICSTSIVTRAGAPTLFATLQAADAVKELGADIPIIADGGIKNPGDAALALAGGASAVMMGNIFAGCKESPGSLISLEGRKFKAYRGMGSLAARKKRFVMDRYSEPAKTLAEGVEGWVPYRGELSGVVNEFVGGLRAAMGYTGSSSIYEMWEKAKFGFLTNPGAEEMRPHDILLPGKSLTET